MKTFPKIKSPGSDALTAEFYLCACDEVVSPLKDFYNNATSHYSRLQTHPKNTNKTCFAFNKTVDYTIYNPLDKAVFLPDITFNLIT